MQSQAASLFSVKGAATAGFEELLSGIRHWRVAHLLGLRDLRQRYLRSKLGQVWLTLSNAIMIGVLSVVWSLLWTTPIHLLMPSLGVGIIIWNYLSQMLTDSTIIFVEHGNLYRNQKMNFSVSIYSVLYKNTIILVHNLIIVIALLVVFDLPVNWYLLQIVPAFGLTCITMIWLGYLIAMSCVRYRDIIQVITAWLLVVFFITPVMWKPDFLPPQYHLIIQLNPLAQFLEILRSPLLGQPVSSYAWLSSTVIALGGGLIALVVIGRYKHRIIFWM